MKQSLRAQFTDNSMFFDKQTYNVQKSMHAILEATFKHNATKVKLHLLLVTQKLLIVHTQLTDRYTTIRRRDRDEGTF